MRLLIAVLAALVMLSCGRRSKRSSDTVAAPEPIDTPAAVTAPPAPSAPPPVLAAPLKGAATIGRVTSSVPVPGAEQTVAWYAADISKCYETALERSPTATGRIDVLLLVEPTGIVVGTPKVEGGSNLPPELRDCVAKALGAARLRGFAGRRATIRVPVTFALARDAGIAIK